MRRTCKRLLALILALALLVGTGSTSVDSNVYAAEVTGQTISGNELTNEPLEETMEETAKVTFEGIDEYGGTKTVTFKIGQRSITQWFNDMYSTWKWSFNQKALYKKREALT